MQLVTRGWKIKCCRILAVFTLGCATSGHGMDLAEMVREHPPSVLLLATSELQVCREGTVHAPFTAIRDTLMVPEGLELVQKAYVCQLSAGESPEFTLTKVRTGVYSYVNNEKQESIVEEVHHSSKMDAFDIVYRITGNRFFGHFQALLHLHASPDAMGEVSYRVRVLVHPENRFWRFLVANVGMIHRFFRQETEEVSVLAEGICAKIFLQPLPAVARPAGG